MMVNESWLAERFFIALDLMIKNLLLPLVCLLVGAAAVYAFRGSSSGQQEKSMQSASGKSTALGSALAATAKSGASADGAVAGAGQDQFRRRYRTSHESRHGRETFLSHEQCFQRVG